MNRKFSVVPGFTAAALGLWIAGPAAAQVPMPEFAPMYFENAYLTGPPAIPGGNPLELVRYSEAPRTPSSQQQPGGAGVPEVAPRPGYGGPGPDLPSGPRIGMPGSPAAPGASPATPEGAMPPGGPPAPAPPGGPGIPTPPPALATPGAAAPAPAGAPAPALASGLGGNVGGGGAGVPDMFGDQGPFSIRQIPGLPRPPVLPPPSRPGNPQQIPSPNVRSLLTPSVRGFKIAENQSPFPQDRVFYTFNFFDDVDNKLSRAFASPLADIQVYRHVFGLEKTFNEGRTSLGLRLPLNTISAGNQFPRFRQGGTSTATGDLTVFIKHMQAYDPRTGNLLSAGLALTPPTGPSTFADAPFLRKPRGQTLHTTTIQPYLAYYLNFGKLFLHGFSAIDVPVNFRDVTILYNDVGLGYYLRRDNDPGRLITAIVPTVEAHLSTPLNHRGEYDFFDPAGTPDVLNITSGVHFEFSRRALLSFGVVAPLTGPRPFDVETILLLNLRFGGSRTARPSLVPVIGG
jgi:hypothetical protein